MLIYEPDDEDIQFAKAIIGTIKEGEIWVWPSSGMIYSIHHQVKVMALTNPEVLMKHDNQVLHQRTVLVWSRLGWIVIP